MIARKFGSAFFTDSGSESGIFSENSSCLLAYGRSSEKNQNDRANQGYHGAILRVQFGELVLIVDCLACWQMLIICPIR